jgi:hypothetical protein
VEPNDRSYDREVEKTIKNMSPEELDEMIRGEEAEGNYRLYINSEQYYFSTYEEAVKAAEKYMKNKPELRIEVLCETEGADFWAYEYAGNKWVPS